MSAENNLDFSAYKKHYSFSKIFKKWFTPKEIKGLLALFLVPAALLASGLQWFLGLPESFERDGWSGLVVMILGLLFLGAYSWLVIKYHERTKNQFQLKEFAQQNDFTYTESTTDFALDGLLFRVGNIPEASRVYDLMTGTFENKDFTIGNRHFENRGGRHNINFDIAFMSIKLDRKLPQMILRSKQKGIELTQGFSKNQVQSLEGDFDKYFTLYSQDGSQADALYVLTPDVMALLIDYASEYDIEIAGNHIYFYARQFDLSESLMRQLFEIIDVVGTKTKRQTKRFSSTSRRTVGGLELSNPRIISALATATSIAVVILRFYQLTG